ncbi:MAG: hypothetical protein AAB339_11830, partial [Elusimicrobiota bacterium]
LREPYEGIASYSTLGGPPGDAHRDLELQIPVGFEEEVNDLLRRLGRREEAQAKLLRVLEINPFSRPALRRLGRAAPKASEAGRSSMLPELYPCGEYCRPWEESWLREGSEGMSPFISESAAQ